MPMLLAICTPLIATLLAGQLSTMLPDADFAMVYLAGVLLTAMRARVREAIICAVLSFLAYVFFHTEPHFTLFMVNPADIVTAGLFLLVAIVTGRMAARMREQVSDLELGEQWNKSQISFAEQLAACIEQQHIVKALADQLELWFNVTCTINAPAGRLGDWAVDEPQRGEENREGLGHVYSDVHSGGTRIWFFDQQDCRATITLTGRIPRETGDLNQLEGFVRMTALAFERTLINERLRTETMDRERAQLRSALLSSISHDLRTPLAAMIGSVSSVVDLGEALQEKDRDELLSNTLDEARRLDGYIQKLLDMTRLGYGQLRLDRDWIGLDDIVRIAIKRARSLPGDHLISASIPADLPLLYVHAALIEQGLFNVIENAVKYSPPLAEISVVAHVHEGIINIDVHNEGPTIPEDLQEKVFDMFFSLSHGDQVNRGTGLGLAICQGVLGAHGGRARILSSSSDKGTVVRLSLPQQGHVTSAGSSA